MAFFIILQEPQQIDLKNILFTGSSDRIVYKLIVYKNDLLEMLLVQESRSIQTIEKSDFFKKSDFLDF